MIEKLEEFEMGFSLIFSFIGLSVVNVGLWRLYRIYHIRKNGVSTQAKVIKSEFTAFRPIGDGPSIPYFQYKVGKRVIRKRNPSGNDSLSKYKLGSRVEIKYDPKRPEKFVILTDDGKVVSILLIAFGALLMFVVFADYLGVV